VSRLPVPRDLDHGAEARRDRLLALCRLRRSLERLSTGIRREPRASMAVSTSKLTRELEELIAALDSRMPRVERAGEVTIARDAAALRAKAVARLAELTRQIDDAPAAPGGEEPT
jgi:hypothetical protein